MSNTAHNQVDVERWGELNVFTLLRKQVVRHFAELEPRVTLSVAAGYNLSA